MNIDLFSLTKTRLAGGDFTPLPDRQRQIDALQLIRSARVGPATFHRLMTEYGGAAAAIRALPEIAAAAGVREYAPCPPGVAQAEWNAGTKSGAQLLVYGAPNYPCSLMGLPDAPAVLWAHGRLDLLARPMVALVGARNASSLGLRMARKLAEGLAQAGVVVVSGLARGIDAAAHGGALTGGTIAVLAGGIDVIYPAENAKLADKIARQGLCLSEQPPRPCTPGASFSHSQSHRLGPVAGCDCGRGGGPLGQPVDRTRCCRSGPGCHGRARPSI